MLLSAQKPQIIKKFEEHLLLLGVSKSTLKNYRSDISFFSSWIVERLNEVGIDAQNLNDSLPFLSSDWASKFKSFLTATYPATKTLNRRLSALRSFSRFLVAIQVCETDFMENISNIGATQNKRLETHPTISLFQKHLEGEKVSKNTVKNYLSDVKHFLSWLENHSNSSTQ